VWEVDEVTDAISWRNTTPLEAASGHRVLRNFIGTIVLTARTKKSTSSRPAERRSRTS
jgi:hypothetical protein